ncbi:MAG: hypothetical protein AAFU71_19985 [Cyanobacteria bacterium J06632_22]
MQSTTLNKLSRQGDATAIATVMNRAFQPHGISVKVKIKADRLKILLEAQQVPNRQRFVPLVAKGIKTVPLNDCKVYVYGRQRGSATIAWVAAIDHCETRYLRVGSPAATAMAASTASLASETDSAPDLSAARLTEEHLIRQIYLEISQRLAIEKISGLSTVSDIEIEGHDVLVTFETRETLDSRALAALVRQATRTLDASTLKIARLYQRHPRTQRSLPIREILLNDAPNSPKAANGVHAKFKGFDDDSLHSFERLTDAPAATPAAPAPRLKLWLKRLHWGLLGLVGLSIVLTAAGLFSPLVLSLILGSTLILWQVSRHLIRS